jgi:hypothetical protein
MIRLTAGKIVVLEMSVLAVKDNRNLDPAPSSLTPSDAAFTTTHPKRG